jgi:hypothetical protein
MARAVACAFALLLVAAPAARGQDLPSDPAEAARVHLGPLALNPTVAVKDVGIDTNVFNEAENPKSDFTGTVAPASDFWFRVGPVRLSGRGSLGYTYFRKYKNQAGFGGDATARLEVPFVRLRPYVAGSYSNTKDRIGYDLDIRSRHNATGVSAGLDVLVSTKTTIGVAVKSTRTRFEGAGSEFEAVDLQRAFDRDDKAVEASARYRLTPLTTITLTAAAQEDRFVYERERNADILRVVPGVEFSPFALISGRATLGFQRFNVLDPRIKDFTGVVASAELGYTLLGVTRFAFRAARDVQYSYALEYPYYVTTGYGLTITQAIAGPFDVQATGDIQRLRYEGISGDASTFAGRVDRGLSYGGGIGYRLGRLGRLGFNVASYRRTSPFYVREFRGLRYGVSFEYAPGSR